MTMCVFHQFGYFYNKMRKDSPKNFILEKNQGKNATEADFAINILNTP